MFMKSVSHGFLIGPDAYLKSNWNKMDFFLVITSLVDIVINLVIKSDAKTLSMLRVFKIIRTLRPLRAINRNTSLRALVG